MREVREMLNRKRNFPARVYLDKILQTHQNYKFFYQKVDLLFKKHLRYVSASLGLENDKTMKAINLEFLRTQYLLKCSVCDLKVKFSSFNNLKHFRLKIFL